MDYETQNNIRLTLQSLEESINSGNTDAAFQMIEIIDKCKFPCKYEIINKEPLNLRPDIMEKLYSTGTIESRTIESRTFNSPSSNTTIEQRNPLDGVISLGTNRGISDINTEIFEKLKKNNPVNAAKYAATGVSNMKEALVKLKEYSSKKK
ncbi:hypothetical protein SteCoe_20387 [Stentor coeruleus]|uniref:Uncharacterized protein n=1 Tax=Stentor coeruleus TaxID=5963 RepID=A0A1R2BRX7_9CILI|nr:hypothetical protein SteCoe_20387 [Stentor coeruleus]